MKRALAAALALALWSPAAAQPLRSGELVDAAVARAASESGLAADLIRRVIRIESGGDPAAISPRGARGLMQLMPATWALERSRLGLGADPFDVFDNVRAGAAYLREMLDRFGAPDGFAAYNAGPGKYADYLAGRGGLPGETRAYLARFVGPREERRRAAGFAPSDAGLFPLREEARP